MKMKLPTSTPSNVYYESNISDSSSENGHNSDLDSPTLDGDFSEYMWMENEEEFDKQVMQQLEEEALMEQCIEAMLEDEREIRNTYVNNQNNQNNSNFSTPPQSALIVQQSSPPPPPPPPQQQQQSWSENYVNQVCSDLESLNVEDCDQVAKQSTLNPDAAEFIPQQRLPSAPAVPVVGLGLAEKAT